MSEPKTVQELLEQAEDLKEELWLYMENNEEHKGIKSTMNELLDLIGELEL